MNSRLVYLLSFGLITFVLAIPQHLQAKSYIAYISDSTNSSVIYWIAKEAGILKKHGLDLDLIFNNGSVRGIQSLIAGDLSYSGAVGPAVINAKLAGADIAIIQSQMNTLPYFIIGNAKIKSPSPTRILKRSRLAARRPGWPPSRTDRWISPSSPTASGSREKKWV